MIWTYLIAGSLLVSTVAGTIGHRRDAKPVKPDEPYRMDIDEAMHRRWQTMHPVRHRGVGTATTALAYEPRHGISYGAFTQEFQRIVSRTWAEAAA